LIKAKRIAQFDQGDTLQYVAYLEDYPVSPIMELWTDTAPPSTKIYAVQTADLPIRRCALMCTDPGDIILDPTCGSGTTAFVAEQFGRRWITCDTSRVAITLAKQRLMTSQFDYYELAYKEEGIKSGFKYKTVPHITLGSIANNQPPTIETLYDQPLIEKKKIRVTGPFTVEAVPSIRTKPFSEQSRTDSSTDEENNRQSEWIDELKATGILASGGKKLEFGVLEPMKATQWLSAKGEIQDTKNTSKSAVVCFGPDFGPLEQRQVEGAFIEARKLKEKPDFIIFAAFHFDPEAAKDIDEAQKYDDSIQILKVQMSADLLTADLRKNRASNQSYWLIGQPDVSVKKVKGGMIQVKVNGFDYYDPIKGEIISKDNKHIAMWSLDTDYDDRSVYPDQVFFPEGDSKRDWSKLAKALNGSVDEEALEAFSGVESIPFKPGEHKKIAVKIIDYRGIESLVIKELE
jgi:adenine-specific DNA-methyltransferase